jgi:hypothetical protein
MDMTRRRIATGLGIAACAVGTSVAAAAGPPQIDVTVDGRAGENGWYTSSVSLTWVVTGADTTSGRCGPGMTVNQPITSETGGSVQSCTATNALGSSSAGVPIKIDLNPPALTGAVPARPPDFNDWYTHPVEVTWTGADGMSGIAACTTGRYGGPDSDAATLTGLCRDNAGHTSESHVFVLHYDATPPPRPHVAAAAGDTVATIRWTASPDTQTVRITRSRVKNGRRRAARTVYVGPARPPSGRSTNRFVDRGVRNGRRYRYAVTAIDPAGNAATRRRTARPVSRLLAPARGAAVHGPPVLRWTPTRRARYYNVQLFRGTRKILSAWPAAPELRLERRWHYAGRARRLGRGTYRWFVFPGFGERSQRRYGELLGTRSFRMR